MGKLKLTVYEEKTRICRVRELIDGAKERTATVGRRGVGPVPLAQRGTDFCKSECGMLPK
jgi:hypothetical protein